MTAEAAYTAINQLGGGIGANTAELEVDILKSMALDKIGKTQGWAGATYGSESHPLYLVDSDAMQGYPGSLQHFLGDAMAAVLQDTYRPNGEGYPLPRNLDPDKNVELLVSGTMRPRYAFLGPSELTQEMLDGDPSLLVAPQYEGRVRPVAVSARMIDSDNTTELGRSARMETYPGFSAAPLIIGTYLDWLRSDSPRAVAQVRAAAGHAASGEHNNVASSAPTQIIYLGRIGMELESYVPGEYIVCGQAEPFMNVAKHKPGTQPDPRYFPIYTPPGPHVAFLEALGRHQTGQALPFEVTSGDNTEPYAHAKPPEMHGDRVYAKVKATGNSEGGGEDLQDLTTALDRADVSAPTTIVEVRADTPEGAATQATLMKLGFIACGLRLAHNNQGKIAPPVVILARLGQMITNGNISLATTEFPRGLYSPDLLEELRRVDAAFRSTIKPEQR